MTSPVSKVEILHHAREGQLLGSVSTSRTLRELAAMVDTALDTPTLEKIEQIDAARMKLVLTRIVNAWREFHAPCVEVERAMAAAQEVLKSV